MLSRRLFLGAPALTSISNDDLVDHGLVKRVHRKGYGIVKYIPKVPREAYERIASATPYTKSIAFGSNYKTATSTMRADVTDPDVKAFSTLQDFMSANFLAIAGREGHNEMNVRALSGGEASYDPHQEAWHIDGSYLTAIFIGCGDGTVISTRAHTLLSPLGRCFTVPEGHVAFMTGALFLS